MALEFLQDVELLRSKEQCNSCGGDMTWCVDSSGSDGYRLYCASVLLIACPTVCVYFCFSM